MTGGDIPQFGVKVPGVAYGLRPSAYGLATDAEGRLLVCLRSQGRMVLPGGGLAEGESPGEGVVREVAEETAMRVLGVEPLCRARQYHTHRSGKEPVNKLCHFFRIDVTPDPALVTDDDHEAVWLFPQHILGGLTYGSHRWAVERMMALLAAAGGRADGA